MPFVGLVSDPRWEPPGGDGDQDRDRNRTWRIPWSLLLWSALLVVLLVLGGVVFPLTRFSGGARAVLEMLPISALADGLRARGGWKVTVPAAGQQVQWHDSGVPA